MKEYKPFETLKAEAAATMAALIAVTDIHAGMLSEEGQLYYDTYDYINDFFIWSDNAAEFIQKASHDYQEMVDHYEKLPDYQKRTTWNNPKIHRLIRKYVKHNFPIELRLNYPEFLSLKEK